MKTRKSLETLGAAIYRVRQQHGLSQREFADSIGCSQGLISKAELGHRDVPRRVIEAICERYRVSASELLSSSTPSETLRSLVDAWSAYDEVRSRLLRILSATAAVLRAQDASLQIPEAGPEGAWKDFAFRNATEAQKSLQEELEQSAPPPSSSHPNFLRLPSSALQTVEDIQMAGSLLDKLSTLHTEDRNLMNQFVERLRLNHSMSERKAPLTTITETKRARHEKRS